MTDNSLCNCAWQMHDFDCPMREDGADPVARTVLTIMLEADGGCHDCAGELLAAFARKFPGHKELSEKMYRERHPDRDLSDFYDRLDWLFEAET